MSHVGALAHGVVLRGVLREGTDAAVDVLRVQRGDVALDEVGDLLPARHAPSLPCAGTALACGA